MQVSWCSRSKPCYFHPSSSTCCFARRKCSCSRSAGHGQRTAEGITWSRGRRGSQSINFNHILSHRNDFLQNCVTKKMLLISSHVMCTDPHQSCSGLRRTCPPDVCSTVHARFQHVDGKRYGRRNESLWQRSRGDSQNSRGWTYLMMLSLLHAMSR